MIRRACPLVAAFLVGWSAGYVAFVAWCAFQFFRRQSGSPQ